MLVLTVEKDVRNTFGYQFHHFEYTILLFFSKLEIKKNIKVRCKFSMVRASS